MTSLKRDERKYISTESKDEERREGTGERRGSLLPFLVSQEVTIQEVVDMTF
jgi:hypothetical protein